MTNDVWADLMKARIARIEEYRAAEHALRERIFWGLFVGCAVMTAAGILLLLAR
jgi:hypothetical protein